MTPPLESVFCRGINPAQRNNPGAAPVPLESAGRAGRDNEGDLDPDRKAGSEDPSYVLRRVEFPESVSMLSSLCHRERLLLQRLSFRWTIEHRERICELIGVKARM